MHVYDKVIILIYSYINTLFVNYTPPNASTHLKERLYQSCNRRTIPLYPQHMSRLWMLDMACTITNVMLAKYSYSPFPYAIQLPFFLTDYRHPAFTFFFLIGLLPVCTWPGVRHILEGAWTHKPTQITQIMTTSHQQHTHSALTELRG